MLLGTTLVLAAVDDRTGRRLLAASSTDAAHLTHEPVRVLVASALWLPSLNWLPYAVAFTLVLAPVERRVGPWWLLAIFASGHVLATLATELPVYLAVREHWVGHEAAHRLDVGVSYGFYTTLAVLAGCLEPRPRHAVLAVAGLSVLVPLALDVDVTSVGHALSLLTGLAWWPWLRRRRLDATLRLPRPAR